MKWLAGFFALCIMGCSGKPEPSNVARPKIVHSDSQTLINTDLSNGSIPLDVSPLDISYCPEEYPKLSVRRPLPVARVIYSRPHKQGRKIFGNLLKYGEPWRLGANEATEIELFKSVTIQGKRIPVGKYILYCIPEQDKWTIVFNSNLYTWGLSIDPSKDQFRFEVPTTIRTPPEEYFSIIFESNNHGAKMIMAWDDVEASLSMNYTEK